MNKPASNRSSIAQAAAWLVAVVITGLGLFGELFGVRFDFAPGEVTLLYAVLLMLAPVFWFISGNRRSRILRLCERFFPREQEQPKGRLWQTLLCSLIVAAMSLGTSLLVASKFADYGSDLPPAYHDEYSYLLQAKTFLQGRLSTPSHPQAPELFDQMHVVNQGRFASRYFPGTGLWLASFVALGKAYWGQWLAGALAAVFVFLSGRELGGTAVGLMAGLLTAVSPGVALFSNLRLAHHPTLLGLTFFLFAFLKLQRSGHWGWALASGTGLAFAMLCRPMTAAGFALPFGIWFAVRLFRGGENSPNITSRLKTAAAMASPILIGLLSLLPYNKAITGDYWTTPYSLFTDTYTPRHVYGFNNVLRAEKNIARGEALTNTAFENYDRWAKNLTPSLAAENVLKRTFASLQWTLGILPLAVAFVLFVLSNRNPQHWLILAGILTLHTVHVPYWFVGIMNWHYVFESAILWLLLLSIITGGLVRKWICARKPWMPLWWAGLILISVLPNWVSVAPSQPSRVDAAVSEVAFARLRYARFREFIREQISAPRALVLIEHDPADVSLDYVNNDPGFDADILLGRFRPGETDVDRVLELFPDRACYLFRVKTGELIRLMSERSPTSQPE